MDKKNIKDGPYTNYYENGHIKTQGDYKNGLKCGKWIYNHSNGKLGVEEIYNNGKIEDGLYIWYNEDGKKDFEKNYKDGKLNGKLIRFHENGQIRVELFYINHKIKDGIYFWYLKNGEKMSETTFKNGECIKNTYISSLDTTKSKEELDYPTDTDLDFFDPYCSICDDFGHEDLDCPSVTGICDDGDTTYFNSYNSRNSI